jgi:alpha-L-arabinofuranosidase
VPIELKVSLVSNATGATVGTQTVTVTSQGAWGWVHVPLSLTPSASVKDGGFVITLPAEAPAAVLVDMVLLEPADWGKFKGLPVRRDIVDGIAAAKLTTLRFGGGQINSLGWLWRNQVGPRRLRQPNNIGTWVKYDTNGFGMFEFLNLCEATGIRPIVSMHIAGTGGGGWEPGVGPIGNNYTDTDYAGMVEYLFGDAQATKWGAQRKADGHAKVRC